MYAMIGRPSIAPDNAWASAERQEAKALARPKFKGLARLGLAFTFIMAAYDLVRLPKSIAVRA